MCYKDALSEGVLSEGELSVRKEMDSVEGAKIVPIPPQEVFRPIGQITHK